MFWETGREASAKGKGGLCVKELKEEKCEMSPRVKGVIVTEKKVGVSKLNEMCAQ